LTRIIAQRIKWAKEGGKLKEELEGWKIGYCFSQPSMLPIFEPKAPMGRLLPILEIKTDQVCRGL
jgi:hypothetical protein